MTGEIVKVANSVAQAFGGWGVVLKGLASYAGFRLLLGGGRAIAGGGRRLVDTARSLRDFGGDLRDAATSRTARRARGRAAKLGSSAFGLAKTGVGKVGGGLASLGRTLGSLALRFAPLALGALKAVGAAVAGLSLPVTATVAAIAGAAYLIWKHWEPIKGFFSNLWESIQSAFSSAWEKLSSIDWSGLGKRLLATLAEGLGSAGGAVWDALKGVLGKLAGLLPGSDARTGPLSRLTASGAAIVATLGEGVRRSGASPLRRSLSGALGAAVAGLSLTVSPELASRPLASPAVPAEAGLPAAPPPASAGAFPRSSLRDLSGLVHDSLGERLRAAAHPLPAAPPPASAPESKAGRGVTRIVHHHYRIAIQQLPGEDSRELADRVLRELERRQALAGREALGDAY